MNTTIAKAGAVYFGIVFAAGFVLGTIRELWVIPRFGVVLAELLEMPFMLIVIVLAARWTVLHLRIQPLIGERLAVGIFALVLLLLAELTLVLGLRQLTLSEYIATREPVSGTVYLVMLGIFALMPLCVRKRVGSG